MPRNYRTVSEDLIEHADKVVEYFKDQGYSVRVELTQLNFPFCPLLVCTRQRTTVIVEICDSPPFDRLDAWVKYGRSCSKDVRVALCMPAKSTISAKDEGRLRRDKVGLYAVSSEEVVERIAPLDLPLNVELPEIRSLHRQIRQLLGPVYDQFRRSNWREGFEDACQTLEVEARRYLWTGIRTGRISILTPKGKVRILNRQKVNSMTMGNLAIAYAGIKNPNYNDSQISKALKQINADRIGVVHHKKKTEARLRKNVGQHMWTVIATLKLLLGLPTG